MGHVGHKDVHPEWRADTLPTHRHLNYKFILCLEGNDVASNLKWVMSSNSIAVMPKPKYETWFMEGKLKGNVHYIEIKDDYSDLEEKPEEKVEEVHEEVTPVETPEKVREPLVTRASFQTIFKEELDRLFGPGKKRVDVGGGWKIVYEELDRFDKEHPDFVKKGKDE